MFRRRKDDPQHDDKVSLVTTNGGGLRPPNLVQQRVELHTLTLRAIGTLHVRDGIALVRVLNGNDRPHLSLSQASLYAPGIEYPPAPASRLHSTSFAAIPKDAITWIVGGLAEEVQPTLQLEPRAAYLVYPDFVLAGSLLMRPEMRFSDAIGTAMLNKPYVTLHDARVLERRHADTPIADLSTLRTVPHVTADLRKATAILDQVGTVSADTRGAAAPVGLSAAADDRRFSELG